MPTPTFAVLVLTAPPPGLAHAGSGAYEKLDGREAVLRSVELFLNRERVTQIQLVVSPADLPTVKERHGPHLSFSGVRVVGGGPRWVDQIAAAAATVSAEATHVIVHDAARPVVSFKDVEAIMAAAVDHPAVVLSTPLATPLVEVDDGGQPVAVHSPRGYAALLTPAAYDRATFDAMAQGKAEPHPSKLTLVPGSPTNVRLGGPGSAAVAKAMLGILPKPKPRGNLNPFEEAQW